MAHASVPLAAMKRNDDIGGVIMSKAPIGLRGSGVRGWNPRQQKAPAARAWREVAAPERAGTATHEHRESRPERRVSPARPDPALVAPFTRPEVPTRSDDVRLMLRLRQQGVSAVIIVLNLLLLPIPRPAPRAQSRRGESREALHARWPTSTGAMVVVLTRCTRVSRRDGRRIRQMKLRRADDRERNFGIARPERPNEHCAAGSLEGDRPTRARRYSSFAS